jgi:hypothetical protein
MRTIEAAIIEHVIKWPTPGLFHIYSYMDGINDFWQGFCDNLFRFLASAFTEKVYEVSLNAEVLRSDWEDNIDENSGEVGFYVLQ